MPDATNHGRRVGRPPILAADRRARFPLRTNPDYVDLLDAVGLQTGEDRSQIVERALHALMVRYPLPEDRAVE